MNDAAPVAWRDWLRSFREQFIAKHGWSGKGAKLRIRDAWAVVRDGRAHLLTKTDQRPVGAVPVFEILTPGGWKLPIQIRERLTGWVTKAMSSERPPRDIVLGWLDSANSADGPDESDEIERKRHSAAFWARRLLAICEHESLSEVAGTDIFWNAVLCALQAGRRLTILELYRNPELLAGLTKAQAFQSGRSPDELTRLLEASYLELRTARGRDPKPGEVAKLAGGRWDELDERWEFDDLDGLPSLTHGALRDRLDKIRAKHSP
jgi:hypothetical protein